MITEDYVSFEVAKLLKDKGLNTNWIKGAKPTHQFAMKWLREVHNKHCDIGYDIDLEWYFQIIDLKEIVEYDYPDTKKYHAENETGFKTHEEAVEAALKYVLENLI